MGYYYHAPDYTPVDSYYVPAVIHADVAFHTTDPGTVRKLMTENPRDGWAITFRLSEQEKYRWRQREVEKFDRGEYTPVPWAEDEWTRTNEHYCHMSIDSPGFVAYTASEEHGYLNRQTKTTPGRYLEKFAKDHLTTAQIAAYVAQVKGADAFALKIATSTEDIVDVYRGGPDSCMHGKHFDTHHPCSVYGESDLAVAYTGSREKASSRCVIWPANKLYSRVYGDETLRVLLEKDGYSHQAWFAGAKVRAIKLSRESYLMPYIDSSEAAELEGEWFTLTGNHPLSGRYNTRLTEGHTGDGQRCERCEQRFAGDEDEIYCPSCEDARSYCEDCQQDTWDEMIEVAEGISVCESCATDHSVACACEGCEETWYPQMISEADQTSRAHRHVTDLCSGCAEGRQGCSQCDDELFDADLSVCPGCGYSVRCDYTMSLPFDSPTPVIADDASNALFTTYHYAANGDLSSATELAF